MAGSLDDNLDLNGLIQSQAKSAGISLNSRQIKRAAEKLKTQSGGQLDALLTDCNPTLSPRDRLRAKIQQARLNRSSATARANHYEQVRVKTEEASKKRQAAKERAAATYQAKLDELEEQCGEITFEQYLTALNKQKAHLAAFTQTKLASQQPPPQPHSPPPSQPPPQLQLLIDLYQRQHNQQEMLALSDSDDNE